MSAERLCESGEDSRGGVIGRCPVFGMEYGAGCEGACTRDPAQQLAAGNERTGEDAHDGRAPAGPPPAMRSLVPPLVEAAGDDVRCGPELPNGCFQLGGIRPQTESPLAAGDGIVGIDAGPWLLQTFSAALWSLVAPFNGRRAVWFPCCSLSKLPFAELGWSVLRSAPQTPLPWPGGSSRPHRWHRSRRRSSAPPRHGRCRA